MTNSRRIGVYNLYWSTLGGGEQVAGTFAQVLSEQHDVVLLGPQPVDVDRLRERLGVDVSRCRFQAVQNDEEASEASEDLDLFINVTFLSRAENRAPVGWYYVNFPMLPPTRRQRVAHYAGVAGVRLLNQSPWMPHRLGSVRAGFDRRVLHSPDLSSYERLLANSEFVAGWVRKLWAREPEVLYPPVRTSVVPGDKRNEILNIGRFFDPVHGHSKKQLELVEAFVRGGFDDWTLSLVGGCDPTNREYALAVRRAAVGHPIDVRVNAPGAMVSELLARSRIYWHAGGFGESASRHPQRFEHFGITVVEAMAAGVVPVVFGAAGPAEIVRDGVDGYHWTTLDDLVELTRRLIADDELWRDLGRSAIERSQVYSADRFAAATRTLVAADVPTTPVPR